MAHRGGLYKACVDHKSKPHVAKSIPTLSIGSIVGSAVPVISDARKTPVQIESPLLPQLTQKLLSDGDSDNTFTNQCT